MWQRDLIYIHPAYRDTLAGLELDSVERVLSRVDGRVAAWSRTTDVLLVPGLDSKPGVYIKRYRYPLWSHRVRCMFRGAFFGRHRGLAEFVLLEQMRKLAIPAIRPIAYGARRVAHFVVASFLITEEAPEAENLTSIAQQAKLRGETVSFATRRKASERLASMVANAHESGFQHGQLFWRNILTRPDPVGTPEFFVLDPRPRCGKRWQSRGESWWLTELAQLLASATPFTTRSERMRFAHAYYGRRRLDRQMKDDLRAIERMSQRWRDHERQRIQMSALFDEWNRKLLDERELPLRAATEAAS